MAGFIGRKRELDVLETAYRAADSAFVPIYGRRRVGKSELILQFIEDKPAIYFLGTKSAKAFQIRDFLEVAASKLKQPFLASLSPRDWKSALEAVWAQWTDGRKLVLVLDEFQWAVESAPELPSVLQALWDLEWSKAGNVFLIVCGSFIGFMEKDVLGSESPLFGRRTAQILLRPFSFGEAALFHPNYSIAEKARTYFICGGVPLYLKLFKPNVSVQGNIRANFLDEYAVLFREVDFLLREELREVENYYSVLMSLASSLFSGQAISRNISMDSRNLPYYLQQLTELGYVSKKYPLTGRGPIARHVRYVISDPLLQFWFRFVYPHRSYIVQAGSEEAFQDIIVPHLPSFYGMCFESLCREALPLFYKLEGIRTKYEIGEYWDKSCQIDVVGYRDDGWTDIGECKWSTKLSPFEVLGELDAKIGHYPNSRQATIHRRVFTRKKPKRIPPACAATWHSLEELYNAAGAQ
jgi:AAA+ ATPase superfamily predicted ATPase